jgi:hypothetical protein
MSTMKLVMVGHYAGKDVTINGHKFVNGELSLDGDMTGYAGIVKYFASYNAYPAGSAELEAAKFAIEENSGGEDGGGSNSNGRKDGEDNSGKHPNKSRASEVPHGDGHDAAKGDSLRGGEAPSGDGSSEGRDSDPRTLQILDALKALDPSVDDHWTDGGLPRVAAIEAASGIVGVTRKEIVEADPDFTREKAAASAL